MKCLLCANEIIEKKDDHNPFTPYYECDNCGKYYIEPVYLRKLELYGDLHNYSEDYYRILGKMREISCESLVVFTDDIDNTITKNDEAIFIEFRDVLDFLNIYVNDISRGSDYGD